MSFFSVANCFKLFAAESAFSNAFLIVSVVSVIAASVGGTPNFSAAALANLAAMSAPANPLSKPSMHVFNSLVESVIPSPIAFAVSFAAAVILAASAASLSFFGGRGRERGGSGGGVLDDVVAAAAVAAGFAAAAPAAAPAAPAAASSVRIASCTCFNSLYTNPFNLFVSLSC